MSDDNNNVDPITGEPVGGSSANQKEIHKVLGEKLGKEFKDEASALKAVEDTFKYVSGASKARKALEAVMQSKGLNEEQAIAYIESSALKQEDKIDTSKFVPREQFEESQFYNEKPEYRAHKALIETFVKANPGKSRAEVLEIPEVKETLKKVISHDTIEKQKSVLHSNPRIGMSTDKIAKAKEDLSKGDTKGAGENAVSAVIDAFEV
jgi:sulfur relay (sulfurtransferase) DsrF/TusC family protein